MPKKVCIQIGHWGIEGIDTLEQNKHLRAWRSTSVLKRSTGAGGERDYHWHKILPLLKDKLISAGIQVYIVDAIWREATYNQEYDLWVSLHYDGGGLNDRCMISSPLRNKNPKYLNESAHNKADEFAKIWKEIYPGMVGVPNSDGHISLGMLEYYAFDYVGYETPAVIIEHFNHSSQRGTYLKQHPEVVVEADFKAILKFLGIPDPSIPTEPEPEPTPTPTPPVEPTPTPTPSIIEDANTQIKVGGKFGVMQLKAIRDLLTMWDKELSDSLANQPITPADVKAIHDSLSVLANWSNSISKDIGHLLSKETPQAPDYSRHVSIISKINQVVLGGGWPWNQVSQIKKLLKEV